LISIHRLISIAGIGETNLWQLNILLERIYGISKIKTDNLSQDEIPKLGKSLSGILPEFSIGAS
jgi:hypothetical protein